MLKALLGDQSAKNRAGELCTELAARGRAPVFFTQLEVPDTIDGRFDMLVLHAWLVLERLQAQGMKEVSQGLVDLIFRGFDDSLRDLGVGDIGIGHRVKNMADAFYGRLKAYGMAADEKSMQSAVEKNIYRGRAGCEAMANVLAIYARSAQMNLAMQDLRSDDADFGPLPVFIR